MRFSKLFHTAACCMSAALAIGTALPSQASTLPWRYKTKPDPLYKAKIEIMATQVTTDQHTYDVFFSCFKEKSARQGIKISVSSFDLSNSGVAIPFKYYRRNETNQFIYTTMRLGDMSPSKARWSRDGYVNRASIELFNGSNHPTPIFQGYQRIQTSKAIKLVENAFDNNKNMIVSGFFPDDPLVIPLGGPQGSAVWKKFRTHCPVLSPKSKEPRKSEKPKAPASGGSNQPGTKVDTSQITNNSVRTSSQPSHASNRKNDRKPRSRIHNKTENITALRTAYSKAVAAAKDHRTDKAKLGRLNKKSASWRDKHCSIKACEERWYKNRTELLEDKTSGKAPSFNCKLAASLPEMLICNNAQLASNDRELSQLYRRAKAKSSNSAAFRRQTATEWRWRENNCSTKRCLNVWYAIRTNQLTKVLKDKPGWIDADGSQALSPEGKTIIWVDSTYGKAYDLEIPYVVDSLYTADPTDPSSIPTLLLRSSPDPVTDDDVYGSLGGPLYTPNGERVYISVQQPPGANYTKILALNPANGKSTYIQTGKLVGLILNGRYQHSLLISKHKYKKGGGSYNPVEVVTPEGKTQLTVPGTATGTYGGISKTRAWITSHGWEAVWRY